MSPADSKVKIREIDFKKLFDSYFPSLCVFANKFVKDEDLSKDIVQEVFVKIWNKVDEFESEKSMKVYFYLSTKNACFDSLKRRRKEMFRMNQLRSLSWKISKLLTRFLEKKPTECSKLLLDNCRTKHKK